jgi:hypothetical protein
MFPETTIGWRVAYFATPFVYSRVSNGRARRGGCAHTVMMLSAPEVIPGLTLGTEVPGISLMVALVRSRVIGKLNDCPMESAPVGKDAFEAVNKGLLRVIPWTFVIGISAVQLTCSVLFCLIVTSPKDSGLVQFSGRDTGDPWLAVRQPVSATWRIQTYRDTGCIHLKSKDTTFHHRTTAVETWKRTA